MTNVVRANRTIEDRARFGVGSETQDDDSAPSTDETQLTAEGVVNASVTGLATQTELNAAIAASAASLKVTSVDGADETTPPGEIYAVTGMSATSVVVAVLFVSTKAAVSTIEVVAPALFTPGTDTLTSLTEVDRTNDQLIIVWFDA